MLAGLHNDEHAISCLVYGRHDFHSAFGHTEALGVPRLASTGGKHLNMGQWHVSSYATNQKCTLSCMMGPHALSYLIWDFCTTIEMDTVSRLGKVLPWQNSAGKVLRRSLNRRKFRMAAQL